MDINQFIVPRVFLVRNLYGFWVFPQIWVRINRTRLADCFNRCISFCDNLHFLRNFYERKLSEIHQFATLIWWQSKWNWNRVEVWLFSNEFSGDFSWKAFGLWPTESFCENLCIVICRDPLDRLCDFEHNDVLRIPTFIKFRNYLSL